MLLYRKETSCRNKSEEFRNFVLYSRCSSSSSSSKVEILYNDGEGLEAIVVRCVNTDEFSISMLNPRVCDVCCRKERKKLKVCDGRLAILEQGVV
jgi:hypothetical protein